METVAEQFAFWSTAVQAVGFVWRGHAFPLVPLVAVGLALAVTFFVVRFITERLGG